MNRTPNNFSRGPLRLHVGPDSWHQIHPWLIKPQLTHTDVPTRDLS